ncbi:hypothetical protein ACUN9W_07055, partial [Escherichia coli]
EASRSILHFLAEISHAPSLCGSVMQTLNNFCPDIAFYSAAGVHVSKGATCFNLEELPVKHWAMSMAQKHVLVVDHSKFGKVRPARMGDLKRFDIVVSDCCPEDEYVKYAQTHRIKLMY